MKRNQTCKESRLTMLKQKVPKRRKRRRTSKRRRRLRLQQKKSQKLRVLKRRRKRRKTKKPLGRPTVHWRQVQWTPVLLKVGKRRRKRKRRRTEKGSNNLNKVSCISLCLESMWALLMFFRKIN